MLTKVQGFIKETRQELNKVSWPGRQGLIGSTTVVIVTTLLVALFIGIVDSILSVLIRIIIR